MAGRITKAVRNTDLATRGKRNLPHLAARLFATPLLVDTRKLDAIVPVFIRKLNGEKLGDGSDDDYREPGNMTVDPVSGIAVIPIIGSIVRRPTLADWWSGLTSYSEIGECLDHALNDARVRGILLQIDSFGGEAGGCFELCEKIYAARSQKPIWAVADIEALSAGYAILCSAERCYVAPRGSAGSIGVISVHMERSRQNEMMGLTYTVFRAGERKGDFNPYEKLTAEAAQKLIGSMERTRQVFADTVARNRLIGVQSVLDTEGEWYDPEDAQQLGLIDGILTYEAVFSQLSEEIVSPAPAVSPPDEPAAPIEPDDGDDDDIDPDAPEELPITQTGGLTMTTTTPADPKAPAATAAATPPAAPAAVPANPAPPAAVAAPPAPATPPAAAPNSVAATTPTGTVVNIDEARQSQESRAMEIARLCKMAGFEANATDFIISNLSVAEVGQKLTDLRAEKDQAPVSGLNFSGSGGNAGSVLPGGKVNLWSTTPPAAPAVSSWVDHLKAAQATNPAGFPVPSR